MSAPVVLETRDLSLAFGGVRAVDQMNITVKEGEILAIIGPNGAGKTSMLNLITRIIAPSRGSIHYKGRDITQIPREAVAGLGMARTFQNIELFEGASVLENLMTGRHRSGHGPWWQQLLRTPACVEREEASRLEVEKIIDFLDLSSHRHSLVAGLPYGVRKIVELARALATGPQLLFLDEPASGLNPEETRELAFWIEDIRSDLGITVVMVEHDMSLVQSVSDRVICMALGRELAQGTASQVQSHPAVIEAYLGSSAVAQARAQA